MSWSTSDRRFRLPPGWPKTRARILKRDGGRCQINGPHCTIRATDVDHIVNNDDHSDANLRAACATCHKHKSASEGATSSVASRARTRRPPEAHPGVMGGG